MSHHLKVLYVDDEPAIRKLLHHLLTSEGYQSIEATTANEAISLANSYNPDLILLDLSLPDHSGEYVLKSIREWSKAPVIILTANKEDDEKVRFLDMGADDYLVKPFHAPELLARLRVAARHLNKDKENPILDFGDLQVDLSAHEVKVRGEYVKLTAKEYEFFVILAKNSGKIVTQGQILKEIWGPHNEENSHYLRVYAMQIRKKVESLLGRKIMITEAGIGYRLSV